MPLYDYACTRCGHRLEVIHGIHAEGPTECPSCGAVGTMRKGFAPPAVHFKGSGWAKKDRRSAASTKAKSDSKDDTAATSGDKAAASTSAGDGGSTSSAPKPASGTGGD